MEQTEQKPKSLDTLVIVLYRREDKKYLLVRDITLKNEPASHYLGFQINSETPEDEVQEKITRYCFNTLLCDVHPKKIDSIAMDSADADNQTNSSIPKDRRINRNVLLYTVAIDDFADLDSVECSYMTASEINNSKNLSKITTAFAPFIMMYEKLNFVPMKSWITKDREILEFLRQGYTFEEAETNYYKNLDKLVDQLREDDTLVGEEIAKVVENVNKETQLPVSKNPQTIIVPSNISKQAAGSEQSLNSQKPLNMDEYISLYDQVSKYIDALIVSMGNDPNFSANIYKPSFKKRYESLHEYSAKLNLPIDEKSQKKFDLVMKEITAEGFWPPQEKVKTVDQFLDEIPNSTPKQKSQQTPIPQDVYQQPQTLSPKPQQQTLNAAKRVQSIPSQPLQVLSQEQEIPEEYKEEHMVISIAIGSAYRTAKLSGNSELLQNLDLIRAIYKSNERSIRDRMKAATQMLNALGINPKIEYQKACSKK